MGHDHRKQNRLSDRQGCETESIDQPWRQLSSKYLYQSKWYNVRQDQVALPDHSEITYTQIEHPGYVVIVPILDDGRVVMERIYRYTLGETLLECPSGGLDGDDPVLAARGELRGKPAAMQTECI